MPELCYGRFALIYDLRGRLWTAGQIRASNLTQLEDIQAGDKVLCAGSETGEDALAAARKGAHVVVANFFLKV